jgi:hypothetical protein
MSRFWVSVVAVIALASWVVYFVSPNAREMGFLGIIQPILLTLVALVVFLQSRKQAP